MAADLLTRGLASGNAIALLTRGLLSSSSAPPVAIVQGFRFLIKQTPSFELKIIKVALELEPKFINATQWQITDSNIFRIGQM